MEMQDQMTVLRVEIDGSWSAEEMATSIGNLGDIYAVMFAVLSGVTENELAALIESEHDIEQEVETLAAEFDRVISLLRDTGRQSFPPISASAWSDLHDTKHITTQFQDVIRDVIRSLAIQYFSSSIFSPKASSIERFTTEVSEYLKKAVGEALSSDERSRSKELATILFDMQKLLFKRQNELLDHLSYHVRATVQNLERALSSISFPRPLRAKQTDVPGAVMQVHAIRYGSPGFKDLIGVGEVIGHLKDGLDHPSGQGRRSAQRSLRQPIDFVRSARRTGAPFADGGRNDDQGLKDMLFRLVAYYSEKDTRKLKREKLSLDNNRLRLENQRLLPENTEMLLGLLRKNGYSDIEVKKKLGKWLSGKQEPFLRLVQDKKILSTRLLPVKSNVSAYGLSATVGAVRTIGVVVGGVVWMKERVDYLKKAFVALENDEVGEAAAHFARLAISLRSTADALPNAVHDYLVTINTAEEKAAAVSNLLKDIKGDIAREIERLS